jgi:hypothetical protein
MGLLFMHTNVVERFTVTVGSFNQIEVMQN